jgi:hypothetical protein
MKRTSPSTATSCELNGLLMSLVIEIKTLISTGVSKQKRLKLPANKGLYEMSEATL